MLSDEVLDQLDVDGYHVVAFESFHEGSSLDIRCQLLLSFEGTPYPQQGWIDVPCDEIDEFSTFVSVDENGQVVAV